MLKKISFFFALLLGSGSMLLAQDNLPRIALVKYNGGGDWYANPTSLPNLVNFANQQTPMRIDTQVDQVDIGSSNLFNYPFVHLTGHGNIVLSRSEKENVRNYLSQGGFLHVDDNYGMDVYVRPLLKQLFPDFKLQQLGPQHKIFSCLFTLKGLPKTHEHDNQAPEAYGIFDKSGRMMVLYTYESDLGDGWESPTVHNDPLEVREAALQMGANILYYGFVLGGY
ncbi:MAG: hypothetical protein ACI9YL_000937 [Luteibaculaceae bacterium]|jgi:hypothetical protein